MNWKKPFLFASVAAVVFLVFFSSGGHLKLEERVGAKFSRSSVVPLNVQSINGFSLSGSWTGPGIARVWISGEKKNYLVSEILPGAFESVCVDSCSFPALKNPELLIVIPSNSLFYVDSVHISLPDEPSALAFCPNCKSVRNVPDHSILLLALVLLICIFGAHTMNHYCQNPSKKRLLSFVFIGGVVLMGVLFGTAVSLSGAFAVVAKRSVSILSAFSIVLMMIIAGLEIVSRSKPVNSSNADVWTELEKEEEKWEEKK